MPTQEVIDQFLQEIQTAPKPAIPLGVYLHHKGGLYLVTGTSLHTETQEIMVEYTGRGPKKYSRPLHWFVDDVETAAGPVLRYRLLEPT